jgi:uncharacterized repeat protein (TIGR01451 family)
MNHRKLLTSTALATLALLFTAGCATQQTSPRSSTTTTAPATTSVQTSSKASTSGYGPSYTSFETGGIAYTTGSMAFPTGKIDSSAVLLEKTVPQDVMVGSAYSYDYTVTNLTDFTVTDVVLTDTLTSNFDFASSNPAPTSVSGQTLTWELGNLGPRQSRTVKVTGTSPSEGTLTTCGIVTFNPVLCETIRVVRADLQLVKSVPATALICDVIPYSFVVTNTGSSRLTNVVVSDPLPAGLTTVDGQGSLRFDVGTLEPGESRSFNADVRASNTGTYENSAIATSAQGVEASDVASVTVAAPVLSISCEAPDERFVGRPINVCYVVSNLGDAAARDVTVSVPLPANADYQGSTGGGSVQGSSVVWNIGNLAPGQEREICATFVGRAVGTASFPATATAACADNASTSCSTIMSGIPAILLEVIDLDDPVEVGGVVTYEITVTNQGSAPGTNIEIVVDLEASQQFITASGATTVASSSNNQVVFRPVASLDPEQKAIWQVRVRALEADDVRFTTTMQSDQIGRVVRETEATTQY